MLTSMTILDVTEATFERDVIERSSSTPVVVDFWGGVVRPLPPARAAVERAASARDGKVVLAKLDTDVSQRLASAFSTQGIPAVKALRGGKVADEFVGVRSAGEVEASFDALGPSDPLARETRRKLAAALY